MGNKSKKKRTPVRVTIKKNRYPSDLSMSSLQGIDATRLHKSKSSGQDLHLETFFLGLGLVFNDLKGFAYLVFMANKFPVEPVIDADFGNWTGMRLQLARMICGFVHELFEFIGSKCARNAVEHPKFKKILNTLNAHAKTDWANLWEIAKDKTSDIKPTRGPAFTFRNRLRRMRNYASFHYDAVELSKGYLQFFSNPLKSQFHEKAYFALGPSLEKTRFFYADAAAQQSFVLHTGMTSETFFEDIGPVLQQTNRVLFVLHEAYLRQL